ncbi:formate dehydrogenase subunit delta [Roseivivax sediminis]|uniref:Formate dehydrogenase subunit delta n=1 Tax=Roseivivax sediminis TaxID=936889 RepID=A0A1I2AQP7_9RHOB|nr:formate dehydrogenase subunit delta [Roseivivax sediminis]SFE46291.1 formate dehydrogenase subunit delta [Roseivivax sediminis]
MSPDKMTHMANLIATFLKTQLGDDGADMVAAHINEFREPRMRAQLFDYVDNGGAGLGSLVLEAVDKDLVAPV